MQANTALQKNNIWLSKCYNLKTELEEVILGACMLENSYNEIDGFFSENSFSGLNQTVWRAIKELADQSHPIDIKTVTHKIILSASMLKDFKEENVAYYVATLTTKVNSTANIRYHSFCLTEMNIIKNFHEIVMRISIKTTSDHLKIDINEIIEHLLPSNNKMKIIDQGIVYLVTNYPEELKGLDTLKKSIDLRAEEIKRHAGI